MDPSTINIGTIIVSVIGLAGTVIGALLLFFKGRGENKNTAAQIREQIDTAMALRAKEELADVYLQLRDLRAEVKDLRESESQKGEEIQELREENNQIKRIFRRFVTDLYAWDKAGRQGPMPTPNVEDMKLLDFDVPPPQHPKTGPTETIK